MIGEKFGLMFLCNSCQGRYGHAPRRARHKVKKKLQMGHDIHLAYTLIYSIVIFHRGGGYYMYL